MPICANHLQHKKNHAGAKTLMVLVGIRQLDMSASAVSVSIWVNVNFVNLLSFYEWCYSDVVPLIQEGKLSVSGERMCTVLVNRLED